MKSSLHMLVVALLLAVGILLPAQAQDIVVGNIRVIAVKGSTAQLLTAGGKKSPLKEGMFLQQGSKILTGGDSTVSLVFENGSSVQVEPSSQFSIDEFVQDPFNNEDLDYKSVDKAPTRSVTKVSISEGEMIFNIAKQKSGSSFEITTPVGVAGIRGTSGSAGSSGCGIRTGTVVFTAAVTAGAPNVAPFQINANQLYAPDAGLGPMPPNFQQNISSTVQSLNSNTPPNTFGGAPPNISPQQNSALQAAAAAGGDAVAQVAAQLAGQNPAAAADIAAAAAYIAPGSAPDIAGAVASAVPAAAVAVAQSVSQIAPQQSTAIATAIITASPAVNPAAVEAAAQAGAQQAAQATSQPAAGNQPLNTGDQGSSTAGQSLPGTTGGSSTGGSGTPPRPTPASN